MIGELVAAAVLGIAAVWFVLSPRSGRSSERSGEAGEPFDIEETARGRAIEALREIEFDRATGKLSDEDYAALKSRYTGLALDAMRAERASAPSDDVVEALIAAHRAGVTSTACPSCGPRPEADAQFCSACGQRLPTGRICATCAETLPSGAAYCECCGVLAG
jgi:hypothetical protein